MCQVVEVLVHDFGFHEMRTSYFIAPTIKYADLYQWPTFIKDSPLFFRFITSVVNGIA